MIRPITGLPCKHEDLSLDPLHPQKSQAWWTMSVSGGWKRKEEAEMFVTLGLAGESSQSVSSRISVKWRVIEEDT